MIKIIKQGNPHRIMKRFYEYECLNCGCVFEFEKEDVEQYDFKGHVVQCPCCNVSILVILEKLKSKLVEAEELEK